MSCNYHSSSQQSHGSDSVETLLKDTPGMGYGLLCIRHRLPQTKIKVFFSLIIGKQISPMFWNIFLQFASLESSG